MSKIQQGLGEKKNKPKNNNYICKTIYFPVCCYNQNLKIKTCAIFFFYQPQREGVFHNQVLRCASRKPCPQGLSGERGEYQVLRTLSCYYHHTVMAFCPISTLHTPSPNPPDNRMASQQLHVRQLCPFTAYFIVYTHVFPPLVL